MIPGEQGHSKLWIVAASAAKVWKNTQSRTPMLLHTQSRSRQLERSRSLAIIHTPRLCDDEARATRGCMSSRSHCGLAERIRKVGSALLPARGREPFLLWRRTRGQQLLPARIETPNESLFLHVARLSQNKPLISLSLRITVFPVIMSYTNKVCCVDILSNPVLSVFSLKSIVTPSNSNPHAVRNLASQQRQLGLVGHIYPLSLKAEQCHRDATNG